MVYELPYGQPPVPPPPPPRRRSRGPALIVAGALVLALVVVVAVVNSLRNGSRNAAGRPSPGSSISVLPFPNPSGTPTVPGSPASPSAPSRPVVPQVACPHIRDTKSHLAYDCIDKGLQQDDSETYLGLYIALNLQVETGWVISEGSGNPTSVIAPPTGTVVDFGGGQASGQGATVRMAPVAATAQQLAQAVQGRTQQVLSNGAYGDTPTARTLATHSRTFGTVTGYEQVTQVTLNPTYRAAHKLTVRTERLWVVGLPTPVGVSIFILTIPDDRSDLWAKAESLVGTVRVI